MTRRPHIRLTSLPHLQHEARGAVILASAFVAPLAALASLHGGLGGPALVGQIICWLVLVANAIIVVTDSRHAGGTARQRASAHWIDIIAACATTPLLPAPFALLGASRAVQTVLTVGPGRLISGAIVPEHALLSRRAFQLVAMLTAMVVLLGGAFVHVLEPEQFDTSWEGVWWAATTVTTVGYGDLVPATVAGRSIAVVLMFTGIGLVSILTASIATALLAEEVGDEERLIERRLDEVLERLESLEQTLALRAASTTPRADQIESSPPQEDPDSTS